ARLRRAALAGFAGVGLAYGLGFWLLGPRLDRRGVEWAFYESAARLLPPGAPVTFLYDDWDRNPYESPFGAFPHDLAVRLFYLRRPAQVVGGGKWGVEGDDRSPGASRRAPAAARQQRPDALHASLPTPHSPPPTLYILGRDRDRPALERLGPAEVPAPRPPVRAPPHHTAL